MVRILVPLPHSRASCSGALSAGRYLVIRAFDEGKGFGREVVGLNLEARAAHDALKYMFFSHGLEYTPHGVWNRNALRFLDS